MKKSVGAQIAEEILFATKMTVANTQKQLEDFKTDKDNYRLPVFSALGRMLTEKRVGEMQVFELNAESKAKATVLYLHGGGYINQINPLHWKFIRRLCAETGCSAVVPNYPMLPKHTFEEAHSVMFECYRDMLSRTAPEKIIFMGDSAGGGFALSLALEAKAEGLPLPKRLVLLSPWVDLGGGAKELNDTDAMLDYDCAILLGKAWANGTDIRDYRLSPLYGDFAGLPPVTIYIGTHEIFLYDNMTLRDRLTAAGVEADLHVGAMMDHVYPLYPIPEGQKAQAEIVRLVSEIF